jgi:hypothetical protein
VEAIDTAIDAIVTAIYAINAINAIDVIAKYAIGIYAK